MMLFFNICVGDTTEALHDVMRATRSASLRR